jgi:hypothetical protein
VKFQIRPEGLPPENIGNLAKSEKRAPQSGTFFLPKHVLEMYGAEPGKPSFANKCLLTRRLVEKGVPFFQLFQESWDAFLSLSAALPVCTLSRSLADIPVRSDDIHFVLAEHRSV